MVVTDNVTFNTRRCFTLSEKLVRTCDAMRNLMLFVQFEKRKKLKIALLYGCFSRFLNCTNGTK